LYLVAKFHNLKKLKHYNLQIMKYDPGNISQYFDEFGIREWDRLSSSPIGEISFEIHAHYLRQFLQCGMRVLEIGAGPGKFTQLLVEIGLRVVVADISPIQVELNRKIADEKGFAGGVEDWLVLDICDLSRIKPGSFDAVVVYGGPFSFTLDQRTQALAECRSVLRPGGLLLLSVMCLWGTAHATLANVLSIDPKVNRGIISSGDLTPETYPGRKNRFMHLFRSNELRTWLEEGGFTVLKMSASGCLSTRWESELADIRSNMELWSELLQLELEACAEPGALDMGTHLIAAACKEDRSGETI
jgi:SAM-dependent methyltransferase